MTSTDIKNTNDYDDLFFLVITMGWHCYFTLNTNKLLIRYLVLTKRDQRVSIIVSRDASTDDVFQFFKRHCHWKNPDNQSTRSPILITNKGHRREGDATKSIRPICIVSLSASGTRTNKRR